MIGKNFSLCFTVINRPQLPNYAAVSDDHRATVTTTTTSSSSSSSSSIMYIKNYDSLYDKHAAAPSAASFSSDPNQSFSHSDNFFCSNSEHDTDITTAATPDFATICASKRFFFSSPGQSNSIIDSSSSSPQDSMVVDTKSDTQLASAGVVAVQTYSPDPLLDFRRSMQEIVDARQLFDVMGNWDCLHELLLCYLSLNPKSAHKFIVEAFADLLISLMASPGNGRGGSAV